MQACFTQPLILCAFYQEKALRKENKKQKPVTDWADYYPFGTKMPGRNLEADYLFSHQGKEDAVNQSWVQFELRMYNPSTGRFNSTDPYGQYYSPYLAMGNNPISFVDPDGGWAVPSWGVRMNVYYKSIELGMKLNFIPLADEYTDAPNPWLFFQEGGYMVDGLIVSNRVGALMQSVNLRTDEDGNRTHNIIANATYPWTTNTHTSMAFYNVLTAALAVTSNLAAMNKAFLEMNMSGGEMQDAATVGNGSLVEDDRPSEGELRESLADNFYYNVVSYINNYLLDQYPELLSYVPSLPDEDREDFTENFEEAASHILGTFVAEDPDVVSKYDDLTGTERPAEQLGIVKVTFAYGNETYFDDYELDADPSVHQQFEWEYRPDAGQTVINPGLEGPYSQYSHSQGKFVGVLRDPRFLENSFLLYTITLQIIPTD